MGCIFAPTLEEFVICFPRSFRETVDYQWWDETDMFGPQNELFKPMAGEIAALAMFMRQQDVRLRLDNSEGFMGTFATDDTDRTPFELETLAMCSIFGGYNHLWNNLAYDYQVAYAFVHMRIYRERLYFALVHESRPRAICMRTTQGPLQFSSGVAYDDINRPRACVHVSDWLDDPYFETRTPIMYKHERPHFRRTHPEDNPDNTRTFWTVDAQGARVRMPIPKSSAKDVACERPPLAFQNVCYTNFAALPDGLTPYAKKEMEKDRTPMRVYLSTDSDGKQGTLNVDQQRKVVEDAKKRVRKSLGPQFAKYFDLTTGVMADAPVCEVCGL